MNSREENGSLPNPFATPEQMQMAKLLREEQRASGGKSRGPGKGKSGGVRGGDQVRGRKTESDVSNYPARGRAPVINSGSGFGNRTERGAGIGASYTVGPSTAPVTFKSTSPTRVRGPTNIRPISNNTQRPPSPVRFRDSILVEQPATKIGSVPSLRPQVSQVVYDMNTQDPGQPTMNSPGFAPHSNFPANPKSSALSSDTSMFGASVQQQYTSSQGPSGADPFYMSSGFGGESFAAMSTNRQEPNGFQAERGMVNGEAPRVDSESQAGLGHHARESISVGSEMDLDPPGSLLDSDIPEDFQSQVTEAIKPIRGLSDSMWNPANSAFLSRQENVRPAFQSGGNFQTAVSQPTTPLNNRNASYISQPGTGSTTPHTASSTPPHHEHRVKTLRDSIWAPRN